ncbi:hypothetical protein [Chryseobacterium sp.]|uniref:helix-turn-helix transcriptional regulator n=1 Tax=Chryseobacterium sp. TaxID=1871047 RepID=UPI002621ACA2|nr:hypothetical protein [Chryseobacterium sp.]
MKLCFIVLFLIANNFYCQSDLHAEVRLLLDNSNKEFRKMQYVESLKSGKDALTISKKSNYSEGITKSSICIAKVLLEIGLYKQGLDYLAYSENQHYFQKSLQCNIEVARLKGRTYGNLRLYKISIDQFRKQLLLSNKLVDDTERNRGLFLAHQNLSAIFQIQKQSDSVAKHLKFQDKIVRRLPERDACVMLSTTYVQNAEYKMSRKDFVNARAYLDSSLSILRKYNIAYLHYTWEGIGDLEKVLRNKEKAIYFYEMALENAIQLNNSGAKNHLYKVLGDYMTENKLNIQKANTYLYYYQKSHDSLESGNKAVIERAFNEILNKNKREHDDKVRQYMYIISVISIITFLLAYFYYSRRKKSETLKKEKQKIIIENENLKTDLIETNSKKLEELIILAKNNSPNFLILFKDLYPDFVIKMTELDPLIKSSELYFCALAYLNFSTKEISQYTFVTVRAVQIRRNRLRKKYNIPSSVDFNQWIYNLSVEVINNSDK